MREHEDPLPRIEDLPLAERGYDPPTVEDAFERFERRLLQLEAKLEVLGDMRDELRELRVATVAGLAPPAESEEWPYDSAPPRPAPEPRWVASVPPPLVQPSALPRILVEAGFLLAVALLAALADLSPLVIAGLMAAAWALVALNEWVAAERRALWEAEEIAPAAGEVTEESSPWDVPPVEATVVVPPDGSESKTMIAKLPQTPPAPRRRWFLRRGTEQAVGVDPWEAEPE